jgi:hypothetical protein
MSQEQDVNAQPLVCYNHPDRETMLRCNRCNRPICTSCAVLTPTGYRCKECVRGQQKIFDTAQWYDYPLAFVVAGVLSFLGSFAASFLGFFTLFIAPVVGVILAEAVRWVVGRRRSKRLYQVAIAGALAGALPLLLMGLIPLFFGSGIGSLLSLLWPGAYVFLVISTAYYRLSGIQIR